MLKHIVMWKLKETAEGRTSQENADLMKKMLEDLKDQIPEIESIEVGVNINSSDAAFDVVLYSEFRNEKALLSYQKHPEHVKVADLVGKINEMRVVVDYLV
ncbi:Dabb family protein [Methanolobus halotolerans]|uniref:Stress responsive protein n=1 Tax=Methanolobus halotolerans TaxID=2052935 RepID=A0A4E0QRZ7_9EURY|nr:Dabb family protein [Methanolobus halotolerans]TGC09521.1 stress responsive protein [Methanolobus halotolerans]